MIEMEPQHYLPHEVVKLSNYPELSEVADELETIETYVQVVDLAIYAYEVHETNRVDLDVVEIERHIEPCRQVCARLGTAPNVCFDALLSVRSFQETLQSLIHLARQYGNEYIGTPTEEADDMMDGGYES